MKIPLLLVSSILSASLLSAKEAGKPADAPRNGYRVFFLGNSFTVNTHFHSEYFAKCAGFTDHSHLCAWSPGMPIGGGWGHWQRPEASAASDKGSSLCGWKRGLSEFTWDRFVIQPFFENQQECIAACNKFYDYALSNKSPNVQMIVKQIWFTREAASYETGRQPNSVAYFEGLADGIQKAHPGAPVYICPSGLVIQELRRLTALGQVPGVTRETDWYADGIHLSKIGNYADGMTQFITLYRVNPVSFNIPANVGPNQWYGYTINEQTADKIKEVAWKVTSAYARSGVTAGPADTTPPSMPSKLTASQVTPSSVILHWTASADSESGIALYRVRQDGTNVPGCSFTNSAVISNLAPRTAYTFTVTAHNRVGLASASSSAVSVTTPAPRVPVTGISLKESALSLNIAVGKRLTAIVVPANADNQGVIWSSSNPGVAVVDLDGTVTGKSTGTATVTATPRDCSNGAKSAAATITVLPNHAPTAAFAVAPAKGKAPRTMAFDGAASTDPDPKDGIFGWDWDFGDGTPHYYGANPSHTYGAAGTYMASLVVLDNNGASSAKVTQTVTVTP